MIQPWAQLIISGEKTIETRSWNCGHRGTLAIHASLRQNEELEWLCKQEPFKSALERIGHTYFTLPRGKVIGRVTVLDCVPTESIVHDTTLKERAFGDFSEGRYGLILLSPTPLVVPFEFKGLPGIFDTPDELHWKTL